MNSLNGTSRLVVNSEFYLHLNATTSAVLKDSDPRFYLAINRDAARLVKLCDGRRNLSQILRQVTGRTFEKLGQQEKENVQMLLRNLMEMGIMEFISNSAKRKEGSVGVRTNGNLDQVFPQVVNLEVTNKCNFECRYCYQNSTKEANGYLEKPIKIMEFLKNNNVRGIELSGGEPLLHPEIESIMSHVVDNFDLLGVITNGSLIEEKHLEILKGKPTSHCTVSFQVCLDGSTPAIADETTGVKDSLEMEMRAINLIKKHGFLLRVGMVIDHPVKIQQIEPSLQMAQSMGADSFVANPALDFGRGTIVTKTFSESDRIKLAHCLVNLKSRYPDFFSVENDAHPQIAKMSSPNCGAGYRTLVIDWNGNAKPCPIVPSTFVSICGWKELASERTQEKLRILSSIEAPNASVCKDCPYLSYCNGCWVRGLVSARRLGAQCIWFSNNQELLAGLA